MTITKEQAEQALNRLNRKGLYNFVKELPDGEAEMCSNHTDAKDLRAHIAAQDERIRLLEQDAELDEQEAIDAEDAISQQAKMIAALEAENNRLRDEYSALKSACHPLLTPDAAQLLEDEVANTEAYLSANPDDLELVPLTTAQRMLLTLHSNMHTALAAAPGASQEQPAEDV